MRSLTGAGLVSLFLLGAEFFLAVRFVLRFFAVDPNGGFASWVLNSTNALVSPFRAVFTSTVPGHPHYVDLQTLFIMAAYVVVASLLTWALGWAGATRADARKK
ncbi:MAG: hypothetical protein WDN27_00710 [Candidatus Saccharibacteria bacterium]